MIINIYEAVVFIVLFVSVLMYKIKMQDKSGESLNKELVCQITYVISFIILVYDVGVDDQGFASVMHFIIWVMMLSFMLALIEVILFIAYTKRNSKMFRIADILISVNLIICAYLTRHEVALVAGAVSAVICVICLICRMRKNY